MPCKKTLWDVYRKQALVDFVCLCEIQVRYKGIKEEFHFSTINIIMVSVSVAFWFLLK